MGSKDTKMRAYEFLTEAEGKIDKDHAEASHLSYEPYVDGDGDG